MNSNVFNGVKSRTKLTLQQFMHGLEHIIALRIQHTYNIYIGMMKEKNVLNEKNDMLSK